MCTRQMKMVLAETEGQEDEAGVSWIPCEELEAGVSWSPWEEISVQNVVCMATGDKAALYWRMKGPTRGPKPNSQTKPLSAREEGEGESEVGAK